MIDQDGDENYQPMFIPIEGGIPTPAFGDSFARDRVRLLQPDIERDIAYFNAESRDAHRFEAYQADLAALTLHKLGESKWGCVVEGTNEEQTTALLVDSYTTGDLTLSQWRAGREGLDLLFGVPLEERAPDQDVPLNSIAQGHVTPGNHGTLLITSLYADTYGLGYLPLDGARTIEPIAVVGVHHSGAGELVSLEHLHGDSYAAGYNIDGCSWLYEGVFDEGSRRMTLGSIVCGEGALANGVMEPATMIARATATPSLSPRPSRRRNSTPSRDLIGARSSSIRVSASWASRRSPYRPARTPRTRHSTGSAYRRACTCPPRRSGMRGRARSSTISTADRRDRSAPTLPGSPCR